MQNGYLPRQSHSLRATWRGQEGGKDSHRGKPWHPTLTGILDLSGATGQEDKQKAEERAQAAAPGAAVWACNMVGGSTKPLKSQHASTQALQRCPETHMCSIPMCWALDPTRAGPGSTAVKKSQIGRQKGATNRCTWTDHMTCVSRSRRCAKGSKEQGEAGCAWGERPLVRVDACRKAGPETHLEQGSMDPSMEQVPAKGQGSKRERWGPQPSGGHSGPPIMCTSPYPTLSPRRPPNVPPSPASSHRPPPALSCPHHGTVGGSTPATFLPHSLPCLPSPSWELLAVGRRMATGSPLPG